MAAMCYEIIFSSLFSKFQTENLSNYARTLDQHFDPELGFADIQIREANSFMPFDGETEEESNRLELYVSVDSIKNFKRILREVEESHSFFM